MATYSYLYINNQGKKQKGIMEADSTEVVLSTIRADGLTPISVTEQSVLNKDINLGLGKKIKPRDYSVFCRQFVSILSAGVTVINALDMLSEQTENPNLAKALKEVQIQVEKGSTLSGAMKNLGKVFPNMLVHMVEAGEASGSLTVAFERMAVQFEKDAELKGRVQKAMIYPIILGVVAVVVLIAMMVVVIPNFMDMFADMDMELPMMTQLVIKMSDFVIYKWYILVGFVVIIIVTTKIYKDSESGKMTLATLAFKLPVFGKLTEKSVSSRLARTLSTLIAAGIPMMEALDITARTMDNELAKQTILKAKDEVAIGVPLSKPLSEAKLFPPMVYQMTKIGEETGNIGEMLEKMADYYDEEVKLATDSLMALMEPLIIVVLAVVVGGIVMAVLQPMMSMYSGIDNL